MLSGETDNSPLLPWLPVTWPHRRSVGCRLWPCWCWRSRLHSRSRHAGRCQHRWQCHPVTNTRTYRVLYYIL